MNKTETKSELDAILVNALINATKEVFQTMANAPITLKEVRPLPGYSSSGDLSAVIGILGEKGEGMLALSFSVDLANIIVSKLLGSNPNTITSDDRCDGIGELANMISGHAKTRLSTESGETYRLSLPSIIMGKQHEIQTRPKNAPYLLMVFQLEEREFSLQVSFKFT